MQEKEFFKKIFYDKIGKKYHPKNIVNSGKNWIEIETDELKNILIFDSKEKVLEYKTRLEWLCKIKDKNGLSALLRFPETVLDRLSENEVGYIVDNIDECRLNWYSQPESRKGFDEWYYEKTGGLENRLKIAYVLITKLQELHSKGYCIVDIAPQNIGLQKYDAIKKETPKIHIKNIFNMASNTYRNISNGVTGYCDPMVYLQRTGVSSISDTYSLAMVIFELITTFHPFCGSTVESFLEKEKLEKSDKGELTYIGIEIEDNNCSDDFDLFKFLLSEDLSVFFKQMFDQGKNNPMLRPTLNDLKRAIMQSLRRIIKCSRCNSDFPYQINGKCPICASEVEQPLVAVVSKIIYMDNNFLKAKSKKKEILEDVRNYHFIKEGWNKLTSTFFDLYGEESNKGIFIFYCHEKKEITIVNYFTELAINVMGKKLLPRNGKKARWDSEITLLDDQNIEIEIIEDAQIYPERIVDINSDVYGTIRHQWKLIIGRDIKL